MDSQKKPLMIIFIIVFIDLVGFGIVIPLHSYLARQFHADAMQVGLLMSIYSLMQFLFAPVWGQISDSYGRRPILLMSLLGASLAHLGFAFAGSYALLFVARMFAGIFGANISTAMAYVADITPENKRSQSMGLVGAAIGLGFVMGPFIGGIFGHIGIKMGDLPPFGQSFGAVIASIICLLNFIWAYKSLKESLPKEKRSQQPKRQNAFKRILILVSQLWDPKKGFLLWMYLFATIAMGHMEVALFLYVDDKFNWSFDQASLGFAYMGLIMAFTQGYLVRKFMPQWGERKTLIIGSILYSLSLMGIGISSNLLMLAAAVTFLGIGIGLTNPALTGSISLLSKAEEQGQMMGISQSLASMGRIIGPAMGSFLYKYYSPETPFFSGGGLVMITLILAVIYFKRIQEKALQPVSPLSRSGEN